MQWKHRSLVMLVHDSHTATTYHISFYHTDYLLIKMLYLIYTPNEHRSIYSNGFLICSNFLNRVAQKMLLSLFDLLYSKTKEAKMC